MNRGGPPPERLSRWVRCALLAVGLGLLALLATAAALTPSDDGYGTHRQLGFPPCSFMVMFGRRCPSCGMTTSWSLLMHGRPIDAARANGGGALLGILALTLGPWMTASGARGRWLGKRPSDRAIVLLSVAVVGTTLIDWGCRLAMEPPPTFSWPMLPADAESESPPAD